MSLDFMNLPAADKIAKYNEINSNAYVNYTPAEHSTDVQPSLDLPKNVSALGASNSTVVPALTTPSTPKETAASKTADNAKLPTSTTTNPVWATPSSEPKAPILPYKPMHPNQNAIDAYHYYVDEKKLPVHVAAGIVGNLYFESGLDPMRKENNGGPGRGIAQWTVDKRWKSFQNWAAANNKNPNDLHTQLDYVLIEPGQESAIKNVMAAKDTSDAVMRFGRSYERPKESVAHWDVRTSIANALINGY